MDDCLNNIYMVMAKTHFKKCTLFVDDHKFTTEKIKIKTLFTKKKHKQYKPKTFSFSTELQNPEQNGISKGQKGKKKKSTGLVGKSNNY